MAKNPLNAAANTPAGRGANNAGNHGSSTSLAVDSLEAVVVAPPMPDDLPAEAGADETKKTPPDIHAATFAHEMQRIPRASFPPFTGHKNAVDREDDSDEYAFPRSRRIICSASSDGQFTIHRPGQTGITLTAAEARTVFQFLEDAQPIFERLAP